MQRSSESIGTIAAALAKAQGGAESSRRRRSPMSNPRMTPARRWQNDENQQIWLYYSKERVL
jgi:hypothetical protein